MTPKSAKAKIVATLGPATSTEKSIRELIDAGVDAFRLNFSHGDSAGHAKAAAIIRKIADGSPVAIIADLQGPRIRIGKLAAPVTLKEGEAVKIASGDSGAAGVLPTTYDALSHDVKTGDRILIDNGMIELRVKDITRGVIVAEVVIGGVVSSNKGINLPGVNVSAPALTEKDKSDVEAAHSFADYFALSFVRKSADVEALRALLETFGADTPIISKIERTEAVEAMDSVIAASDGVMVARGDLGVELPEEQVPLVQKRLIARANALGKPVITATEMLQSMIDNPRPTRAEASDVANAILDGTDAVMLSGETAIGKYPVESVITMNKIAREAERIRIERLGRPHEITPASPDDYAGAVADAACAAAGRVNASAIVVTTMSGRTAMLLAQCRPSAPIIVATPSEKVMRQLSIVWSVLPVLMPIQQDSASLVANIDSFLKTKGLASAGQTIVIVGGAGPQTGTTNFTKIHRVR